MVLSLHQELELMEQRIDGPRLREPDTIVPMTHRQVIASISDCLERQQMSYTRVPINLGQLCDQLAECLTGPQTMPCIATWET